MRLTILMLACISSPVVAQWHLGGKIGVSFSHYESKVTCTEVPKTGLFAGVTAVRDMGDHLGLGIDLLYIQKGYYHKVCNTIYDKLDANYVELPVQLTYRFVVFKNFQAAFNLGVYSAFWLSGRYRMQGFDASVEEVSLEAFNRLDFGPGGGGRIQYILRQGSMSLDFRYARGLVDMATNPNDDTKNINRCFTVGVAYMKRF